MVKHSPDRLRIFSFTARLIILIPDYHCTPHLARRCKKSLAHHKKRRKIAYGNDST
jgi:hypothetical protein